MNVLITDGENRSSLAVTRSLGRRGCNVIVTGKQADNLSAASKYCQKFLATPDPLNDTGKYTESILNIVNSEAIDLIFPMTEQSIYCLNGVRELFEKGVILASAATGKMEAMSNKYKLFKLAETLGVFTPETLYITDTKDFEAKFLFVDRFPVVVKPALSKIMNGGKILSTGVMYAANREELFRLYETKPALQYPSLIQEMVVGEGTGLFTLFDEDRHIALFSHRRLLEKPPSGGVSVLSESVPLDAEMVEAARKLLSAAGWKGIAMVEFKRDARDGHAKLMEVNGRFWGSLQLAISSGIDFPALCLDYYTGRRPESLVCNYKVGQRLKWFFGILDHMIIRVKHPDSCINLPVGTPSIVVTFGQLLGGLLSSTSSDVFDWHDIKPSMIETMQYVRGMLHTP